jgi:hypothetical protein
MERTCTLLVEINGDGFGLYAYQKGGLESIKFFYSAWF